MLDIFETLFSLIVGAPWWLFAFTAVLLLQLGVAFGVTWRYSQWVLRRLATWKRQPKWTWPFFFSFYTFAAALAFAFIINDWLTNLLLSAWWLVITKGKRGWPCGPIIWRGRRLPWLQLVTGRTQIYLDQWRNARHRNLFNRAEVLTMRFIIGFAHLFDKKHFKLPPNWPYNR